MDIVIIMTILDKIMEMIRECRENQSREQVLGRLKSPGPREGRMLLRVLRREGYHGRELRAIAKDFGAALNEMDDDELGALMDDVEEMRRSS
jgi:hypothetical protein